VNREHVDAFLAVRPWYSREHVEDLEDTSVSLNIPWCPSCADWHDDDEPHSSMDDEWAMALQRPLAQTLVWLDEEERRAAGIVDDPRPQPAWSAAELDLDGRPFPEAEAGVHPHPEDGYMTPAGCVRLVLILCLIYLAAWVVIDRLTH
jgi:hypothetical protein